MGSLISIIIPTYNRCHLIGETLDSIIIQQYTNWECLVIDDHSTDYTQELMEFYGQRDERLKFYIRSAKKPKGANACRNLGLELAQGEFVIFFDSDDLMTPDHLLVKYEAIKNTGCDFVIAKAKYLTAHLKDEPYNFEVHDVNLHNYIIQKVNWLTYDIMVKTYLAKSIHFNENLQSGQEFNYFAKLLALTNKSELIDSYVTLRRKHNESISASLNSKNQLIQSFYKSRWHTYLDLKCRLEKRTREYIIKKCILWFFNFEEFQNRLDLRFLRAVNDEFGKKRALQLLLSVISYKFIGKGYWFVKRARRW